MNGQVCVVTGATSGIGLETARQLAVRGARVVMTGRSEERGEAALANIRAGCPEADLDLVLLDLADLSNVRHAGRHLRDKYGSISVLVNNAGVYEASRTQTVDGFEATFAVNHLGPFLFTNLLLPSLLDCPTTRVVNVSSEAHRASEGLDYSDLQWTRRRYSALRSYADSKLANLLFTRSLSKRFDPERLVAHAVHPGAVATGLFRGDQPLWMRMGVGVAKHFLRARRDRRLGGGDDRWLLREPPHQDTHPCGPRRPGSRAAVGNLRPAGAYRRLMVSPGRARAGQQTRPWGRGRGGW